MICCVFGAVFRACCDGVSSAAIRLFSYTGLVFVTNFRICFQFSQATDQLT